jgi:hypothetical protein
VHNSGINFEFTVPDTVAEIATHYRKGAAEVLLLVVP